MPEGSWQGFCLFRFIIGVGVGGAATAQAPYIVELTPTRVRSLLPGLVVALSSLGILVASSTVATLMSTVGWRGMALIGGAPILIAGVVFVLFPESPRWLVARGRYDAAAKAVDSLAGSPLPGADRLRPQSSAPAIAGLRSQKLSMGLVAAAWLGSSTAFNGIYLWGPSMLAMVLGVAVPKAAAMFILVSLAGLTGKLIFALAPQFLGRRRVAVFSAVAGASFLALAAFAPSGTVVGVSFDESKFIRENESLLIFSKTLPPILSQRMNWHREEADVHGLTLLMGEGYELRIGSTN